MILDAQSVYILTQHKPQNEDRVPKPKGCLQLDCTQLIQLNLVIERSGQQIILSIRIQYLFNE